jgi:hypothetical protein
MIVNNHYDEVLQIMTNLKRQADQTGQALLRSPLTEGAGRKILECAEQVSLMNGGHYRPAPITFYCKHRQCPICQWRRSQRACAEMHQLFEQNPCLAEGKWLFLTLTVRNCQTSNLRETLNKMTTAFQRMTRRQFWTENVLGAIRYTEVSVGESEPHTAHPHFHCLLLVRPSMFAGNNYMSEERWADAWASALQEHYLPTVNAKRLGGSPEETRDEVVTRAVYSNKARTGQPDADWLITVTQELKGLRFVQASGVLDAMKPQLNDEGVTEADSAHVRIQARHGARFHWDHQSGSYHSL